MPRNGSGTYSLPAGINPVVADTVISSDWANTTLNDLASAMTQSLARDGQTVPVANLPMGGFRHLNVSDPSARNQYASLKWVQDGNHYRLTSVGGTDTITASLLGNTTSLVAGQIVQLIPVANNTGAVTLNINSIGPKSVLRMNGDEFAAGQLISGVPYLLSYDGTDFITLNALVDSGADKLDVNNPAFTGAMTGGSMTLTGGIVAGSNLSLGNNKAIAAYFHGPTVTTILGTNSAGTIYIRPSGALEAADQTTFTSAVATFGTRARFTDQGIDFGSVATTGANLSNHISLFSTSFGFNIVSGAMQAISNGVVRQQWTTGGVTITGTLTATGNGTFNTSDERLKSNIRTIQGGLHLACMMRGVRYTKDGEECVGFIAQEMQKVLPSVVMETDTPEKYLALSYEHITPVLVEAIKELRAQIEELKKPWWKKLIAKVRSQK